MNLYNITFGRENATIEGSVIFQADNPDIHDLQIYFDLEKMTDMLIKDVQVIGQSDFISVDFESTIYIGGTAKYRVLNIECDSNNSESSREGQIRICGYNTDRQYLTITIPITQEAGEEPQPTPQPEPQPQWYFNMDVQDYHLNSDEHLITIPFESNCLESIEPSYVNWIDVDYKYNKPNGYVEIVVHQNTWEDEDTGEIADRAVNQMFQITLQTGEYIEKEFEIFQEGVRGEVTITNSEIDVPSSVQTTRTTLQYNNFNIITGRNITTDVSWLSARAVINHLQMGLTITVAENTTAEPRTGHIYVTETDMWGNDITVTITVNQERGVQNIETPIWKDCDIDLGTDTPADYEIYVDGKSVYKGRTYTSKIRLNNILRDCLYIPNEKDYNIFAQGMYNTYGYKRATLYVNGELWGYINFTRDWSYNDNPKYLLDVVPEKKLLPNQYCLFSVLNKYEEPVAQVTFGVIGKTVYNYRINNNLNNLCAKVSDGDKVWINNYFIDVKCDDSIRYVMYYRYTSGAYGWLFLNNTSKQTDKITNYDYKRVIDNKTLLHETLQYQKNVETTWNLKTRLLNDSQSETVANIMRSNDCYLHDLYDDRIYPVNITQSSVDHKTFKNNSRKKIQYTFTVQMAQERIIK